jgi:hypothetical protein
VSLAKAVVKVAVNAVVVALNVVMTYLLLTVVNKLLLPIAMHQTSVLSGQNALSRQSPQTRHRKATRPLPDRTIPKNVHRANAAAVTVMVASDVNVVIVPSHRQTKPLTPAPRPSCQCPWSMLKPARL